MAGASGLIGTYLSGYLRVYNLLIISRNDLKLEDGKFAEKFKEADIIINLSGSPVIQRWTRKNRNEILNSRVRTTGKLGCIMEYHPDRERLYLSASAIGVYNDEDTHTEESNAWGKGFMTEVVKEWEAEVRKLESKITKVCIMRTGVVLAAEGGMLARLIPLFRKGLGARIGRGDQYFSWIHIRDVAMAMVFLLENKKTGIYNMTAPGYCTNREFTRLLGYAVNKPAWFMIPKIMFSLLYGRGAAVVTGGQAVVPARLIKDGYRFKYQYLDKALEDIVN